MNVSLLLPSEAKTPGDATAPASPGPAATIPLAGGDFLKFMGLAGKSRADGAPGQTDALSAPTPEQTVPLTEAIASISDRDKLPPNLGTATDLFDTSFASLRLVLRAVPPVPLSQQVKSAETGAGAETNSKVAQIMDMGQGKTVGGQNGWSRLADNARPALAPAAAHSVKSARIAPARPPSISVRNKSLAIATPLSQAPARSNAAAVTKNPVPLLPPRAPFPLAQPPLKISSPNATDHLVAVAPDNPAKIPVATAHTDDNQTPPPNPIAAATSVDASVAIPLISAVVTPIIPLPVPVKSAEKTASVETNAGTAQPEDMGSSIKTGGQSGRSASSTIVHAASNGAHPSTATVQFPDSLAPRSGERGSFSQNVGVYGCAPSNGKQLDNAPVQTGDSPAPRSDGRVGPPAVLSATVSAEPAASPKAEEKISSDPAGGKSTVVPSGPPVAAPASVKQNNDAILNAARTFIPDPVSADSAPTTRPWARPVQVAVTKEAGLSVSPQVAPDDAGNETVEADVAPPSLARFTAPQPKETENAVAADSQSLDPVKKQPAPAAAGQGDPSESLPVALPVPSGSGHAAILELVENSPPEKSLTSPAPAEEPAPAHDSTSFILPPPSPGPGANHIIDVPISMAARSADDHPPIQPGTEAAVNTSVAPSQIDRGEIVPPDNLAAAAAADARVTNPPPPPAPAPPLPTPISAEIDFKTPAAVSRAPIPPSGAPARSADDPSVRPVAEAAVNTPIAATQINGDETRPSNNVPAAGAAQASAANLPPPPPPPLPQTPIIAKTDFITPAPNPSTPAAVPQIPTAHTASSIPMTAAAGQALSAQPTPAPSPVPKPTHLAKAILPDSAKISLQDKLTVEPLLASAPPPRPGQWPATKEPAPSLSPPATPIGTTVATNQERMKSAVNVNEFAGSTGPVLPLAGQVAPAAGVADNGSQGALTARPIEIDFSNNKDTSAQWMVPNLTPAGTSSQTTTANSAGSTVPVGAPLAQVERMISREVTMVRQSGAQALAVTLKVDSRTSLFLQLTNHDGQIEASVRCEKGSPAGLDTHWSELQESLARQNVQLLPLQDNSRDQSKTPAGTFADLPGEQPPQKQPEPRPETAAETEPPPSDDAMNAAVGMAKSKHRTHPRHGWEKWA